MKTSTDKAFTTVPAGAPTRHSLSGETMGTRYSAVFYAPESFQTAPLSASLLEAVERVDRQMSTWKPNSDLNRLNEAAVGAWVVIPRELMTVLAEALRIGRLAGGAFDIGVGALVNAWGFGPAGQRPDRGRIAAAFTANRASTPDALHLDRNNGRARKTTPLSLDLSAIAKGFGVDEMARVMDEFGIEAWLVGIDGEMRARGLKPDGSAWAVAHERPDRFVRDAMGVFELSNSAIATSGNYRRWLETEEGIASHTMSPAAGVPVDNDLASVSVIAPSCMTADAWATALLVCGADEGMRRACAAGIEAIFVLKDGTIRSTP